MAGHSNLRDSFRLARKKDCVLPCPFQGETLPMILRHADVHRREDPRRIVHAGAEFFRVFMPLTHIGRVCPVDTSVHGVPVKAGGRVSLAWSSANFDETVFDAPEDIRLDRKPNPHLSFGFGPHLCLGAPHAPLIVRSLLEALTGRVERITVLEVKEHIEHEACYERTNGYDSLTAAFEAR